MTDPSVDELRQGSGSNQRPSELLRTYVSDPQSPRPDEVQCLVSELDTRHIELEARNQELREAQRQLEAYRDRYVDLYDFAPLGYVTLDEEGYVQEINLAGAKMLGEDRDAITGYAFGDYVAKEDQEAFRDHLRKCAGERAEVTSELRLVAKDGQSIVVQLRSMPIEGPKEDTLCKTAITDITERKNMEEATQQSRAFLQTVIDAIPDTLLVIGQDYRISLANRAAREMAGGIDPTVFLTCHQLSHHCAVPCEGLKEPCPMREVIATRAATRVTHTHYDANGKEVFVEVSAAPVFNAAGEVTHVIEACRDITDRMRQERALRLTQFSVDHAGDAVFWLGPDARFFYANARACQQLGYSQEELASMTVHDVDPNFPAEVWPRHWEELKRRGCFAFESQHRTKDGGLIPVDITVNYLEFGGQEFNCAYVRDITERKRAEEEMARLASFPMLDPQPIVEVDMDGRVCFANPAAQRLFPDLQQVGLDYPWLLNWDSLADARREPSPSFAARDMAVGERHYHQVMHYVPKIHRVRIYWEDITERKRADALVCATNALLTLVPEKSTQHEYMDAVVELVRSWTGCRCVGIRGVDEQGQIPCEAYTGFSQAFWSQENELSCMKANVPARGPVWASFCHRTLRR